MDAYRLPDMGFTAFNRRIADEFAAGWFSHMGKAVLLAIARLGVLGEPTPTVRRIAVEARCSDRTVRRVIALARERGLLGVARRFEIVAGRPQQRANRYTLAVPMEKVTLKPRQIRGGQRDRPIQGSKKERRLGRWLDEPNRVGIDLLAARRAAMAAKWTSRRLM